MKAYSLSLFFMLLNGSFWMMEAMNIWSGPASPGGSLIKYFSYGLIFALVGAAGLAAVVLVFGTRLTTPDIVALSAFAIGFWFLFGATVGILNSLYVPSAFITLLGVIHGVVFFIAIVQIASHASLKLME